MREPAPVIYLSDTRIFLYEGGIETISFPRESFEKNQKDLFPYLNLTQTFCLVIESTLSDIHDDLLPQLPFWDYIRLILHKKAFFSSGEGIAGLSFFKNQKEFVLRWVHYTPGHFLYPWIEWALRGRGRVFFTALEAGRYTQKNSLTNASFLLLTYPLPSGKCRLYVYKGRCLLLSRHIQDTKELPSVLHFLERSFADIQGNVEVLNIEIPTFLKFIGSQKHPLLALKSTKSFKGLLKQWAPSLTCIVFSFCLLGEIYEVLRIRERTFSLLRESLHLKKTCATLHNSLSPQEHQISLEIIKDYLLIKPFLRNPLGDLKKISPFLTKHSLHLKKISWRFENKIEIIFTFLINSLSFKENLDEFFENLLLSLKKEFKGADIDVLSAPYNSRPEDVLESSLLSSLPSATLKVSIP